MGKPRHRALYCDAQRISREALAPTIDRETTKPPQASFTIEKAIDVLRRMLKFWSNQDDDGPSNAQATQAVFVIAAMADDVRVAAGECRVSLPTPGTDAARLLTANAILRRALQRALEARAD